MLKSFLINQSIGSIDVEERYETWVQELRTDKYVTVHGLS